MMKSIVWRLLGIAFLAVVTYAVTGSLITTTLVTFFHHLTFIFIYYFHERAWLRFGGWISKKRRFARIFTYEIILGHMVLGIISWVFTGSWTAVTLITIIYIENKLWMYAIYDWLWSRSRWGVYDER